MFDEEHQRLVLILHSREHKACDTNSTAGVVSCVNMHAMSEAPPQATAQPPAGVAAARRSCQASAAARASCTEVVAATATPGSRVVGRSRGEGASPRLRGLGGGGLAGADPRLGFVRIV